MGRRCYPLHSDDLMLIVQASEVLTNNMPREQHHQKQSNQREFKNTKVKWPVRDSNPPPLDFEVASLGFCHLSHNKSYLSFPFSDVLRILILTIGKALNSGLLNESHPRVFQTITLSFFIAFKAKQG